MSANCETKFRRGLRSIADKIRLRSCPLIRACLAELCGTAILVTFGCGVLAQVFLGDHGKKAHGGFLSISLGWGMAVTFGVFFSGIAGSGNINPAITLAFALIGKVPMKRILFYTFSQILGAYIGALTVYLIYREKILERVNNVDEGNFLIDTTGNIFVTNPWGSHMTCFVDQVIGTALLAAGALAVVDHKGWKMPGYLHPLYLGLLVYTLVGCFAMNAGCALNPARDLGPRLMLLMCGWGTSAFSEKNYFFWIPIVGPYIGAVIGAVLYELTIGIHLDTAGDRPGIETPGKTDDVKKDEMGTELLA